MKKSALYLTLTLFGVFLFATIAFGDSAQSTTPGGVYNWWTWVAPNNNGHPYWDNTSWDGASCNIGNRITNSGCNFTGGPGAIPFWGRCYNSTADTGGEADPNFFFQKDILSIGGSVLTASLTAYKVGATLDQFGWYDASTPAFLHSSYPMLTAANPTGTFASYNACFSSYGFYLKTIDTSLTGGTQIDVVYRTEASKNQRLDNMSFFDTTDQHFAVFRKSVSGSPDVYWIGMEDLRFANTDKDYNDIIATVQTTPALTQPEYYFTSPTVTTVRILDQDTVYLSSFMPNMNNSYQFWPGNLKAYQLNADGTLPYPLPTPLWSAGDNLENRDPVTRNIKTFVGNSMKDFNTSNLTDSDLGVSGGATQIKRSVTVNSNQVSGGSLTGTFPMLISNTDPGLKNVANGGHVLDSGCSCTTRQQGCDIYFTTDSSGLNVLPSEIEQYNGSTGTLVAWVGVPSIANGTVIYMWYGSNVSTYNPTGVWDSNYKLVYHLGDASSPALDSTVNANNGTQSGGVTFGATGQIDGATTYANGATSPNQYIGATLRPLGTSAYSGPFTYSLWIKVSSYSGGSNISDATHMSYFVDRTAATAGNPLVSLVAVGSSFAYQTRDDNANNFGGPVGGTIPASTVWTHIAMVRDYSAALFRLYANGVQVGTFNDTRGPLTPSIPKLGRHATFGSPAYLNGSLDEFRISNTARSPGWIQTEYNNQSSPSTFYTLGPEPQGTPCGSECQNLISYVRGTDTYNIKATPSKNLKLGDIFHSNPVIVGEPSRFFQDVGFSGTGGFYQNNQDRTKVLIVGANDGMLHAFNAGTGDEVWGFIPNSLLKSLKLMTSRHTYYVDSSPKVADVWFDYNGDHKKTANEWKTVLVSGLKKGGKSYFALDITDTSNPQYLWEFPSDAATLVKLGQSWSEPAIGRVKVGGNEKWVAFIGGGFDSTKFINITTGRAYNDAGMAFFVVDMQNGSIIKEFSKQSSGLNGMIYPLTAPPTAVDTNFDGYIDRVYIGDVGGQMWVFDVSNSDPTGWTGNILFTAPVINQKHPIFYQASVAFDKNDIPWVYFGTGDRENPTSSLSPYEERFYAVRDDGIGNYPRTESDLKDATSTTTFSQDTSKKGWYIVLQRDPTANTIENVVSKPVIFNQLVYFTATTYNPTTDPCAVVGTANLYTVEFLSGGGAVGVMDLAGLSGTPSPMPAQFKTIGTGVPSAPVISVDSKGLATIIITTSTGGSAPPIFPPPSPREVLYWREVIR